MPITTSTGSVVLITDETFGWDNLSPLAGVWRNTFWDQNNPVTWGKTIGKLTFVFERIVFKFSNITPVIPKCATILSAKIRGTSTTNSDGNGFFTVIIPLAKDTFWNPVNSGQRWRSVSQTKDTDMDIKLLSTGLATMTDTAQDTNQLWGIRDNIDGRHLKAAQTVINSVDGTLGFADIRLKRVGAIASGNIWCEIYDVDTTTGLPTVLLATSDTISAVTTSTTLGDLRFTFSGIDQINIPSIAFRAVVLNGDYPLTGGAINVGFRRTGNYPFGGFFLFGTGIGFDDFNLPLQTDYRGIANAATGSPPFVVWVAPRMFVGVDYDTPDLSALLQQVVDKQTYAETDALGWAMAMSEFLFPGVTSQRSFANAAHATLPSVRFIVDWAVATPLRSSVLVPGDLVKSSALIVEDIVKSSRLVKTNLIKSSELVVANVVKSNDLSIEDQIKSSALIVDDIIKSNALAVVDQIKSSPLVNCLTGEEVAIVEIPKGTDVNFVADASDEDDVLFDLVADAGTMTLDFRDVDGNLQFSMPSD